MLVRPNKAPAPSAAASRPQQTAQQQAGIQQGDAQAPEEPAEAAVIKDLLKSLGIKKYDPRIVTMLVDFTWRTTSDILQDAEAINKAAGGTGAELTPHDIALAASQQGRCQAQPPSLQELHALARKVNTQPLVGPSDKQHGIKLPTVADCLLSQNYQVRQRPRPAAPAAAPPPPQPPRQHYAVKQQHGKLGMAIPQQWQPKADPTSGSAEPFAPPQYRGTAGAAGDAAGAAGSSGGGAAGLHLQQGQQQAAGMDIDHEEI
ncbi:hypothetical protein ABPG75_006674 [Micractinium tetrahymenae]